MSFRVRAVSCFCLSDWGLKAVASFSIELSEGLTGKNVQTQGKSALKDRSGFEVLS